MLTADWRHQVASTSSTSITAPWPWSQGHSCSGAVLATGAPPLVNPDFSLDSSVATYEYMKPSGWTTKGSDAANGYCSDGSLAVEAAATVKGYDLVACDSHCTEYYDQQAGVSDASTCADTCDGDADCKAFSWNTAKTKSGQRYCMKCKSRSISKRDPGENWVVYSKPARSAATVYANDGVVVVKSGNGAWGGLRSMTGTHFIAIQGAGSWLEQIVSGLKKSTEYTLSFAMTHRPHYGTNEKAKCIVNGNEVWSADAATGYCSDGSLAVEAAATVKGYDLVACDSHCTEYYDQQAGVSDASTCADTCDGDADCKAFSWNTAKTKSGQRYCMKCKSRSISKRDPGENWVVYSKPTPSSAATVYAKGGLKDVFTSYSVLVTSDANGQATIRFENDSPKVRTQDYRYRSISCESPSLTI